MKDRQNSLDRRVDLELRGRGQHTIYRRFGLALLALVVLAALLNVFGQQTTTTVAEGRKGTLTVDAPPRLRGGLIFQARFEIEAKQRLAKPKLLLSQSWLDSMTLNTVAPTPVSEDSSRDGFSMSFEELSPGEVLILWTEWQVNPVNVGRHSEDATLFDGATPIASAERTLTVFP